MAEADVAMVAPFKLHWKPGVGVFEPACLSCRFVDRAGRDAVMQIRSETGDQVQAHRLLRQAMQAAHNIDIGPPEGASISRLSDLQQAYKDEFIRQFDGRYAELSRKHHLKVRGY